MLTDMSNQAENERLKKQLEKDRADIMALQQKIKNFAAFGARCGARRDDVILMLPLASAPTEG
jgi:hypothetical protein